MKSFQEVLNSGHCFDKSGIDNPNMWLWDNDSVLTNVYYPRQELVINPMFRKLLVDGDETTIDEFIAANTAPDVEPLTDEEIESVRTMNVGDILYFGMSSEVKRIY